MDDPLASSAPKALALVAVASLASVPRSIEFYGRLGFAVGTSNVPPCEEEPSWAWLCSGEAHLMVARAGRPVAASQQAVLFSFCCDDVDACRERVKAAGIAAGEMTRPFGSPRGEFPVTDPDEYCLMLTHRRDR